MIYQTGLASFYFYIRIKPMLTELNCLSLPDRRQDARLTCLQSCPWYFQAVCLLVLHLPVILTHHHFHAN